MKLRVLDFVPIKLTDGTVTKGKIRRIGASDPGNKGYVMLTLDVSGTVAYCAARETELADDHTSA